MVHIIRVICILEIHIMKEYWDFLTKEQQCSLAGSVGSTPGYLRLVFNGYKKWGFVSQHAIGNHFGSDY